MRATHFGLKLKSKERTQPSHTTERPQERTKLCLGPLSDCSPY